MQSSLRPWDEKSCVLQLWKESAGFHAGLLPCIGDRWGAQTRGRRLASPAVPGLARSWVLLCIFLEWFNFTAASRAALCHLEVGES